MIESRSGGLRLHGRFKRHGGLADWASVARLQQVFFVSCRRLRRGKKCQGLFRGCRSLALRRPIYGIAVYRS